MKKLAVSAAPEGRECIVALQIWANNEADRKEAQHTWIPLRSTAAHSRPQDQGMGRRVRGEGAMDKTEAG